jgi:hypothetical protein
VEPTEASLREWVDGVVCLWLRDGVALQANFKISSNITFKYNAFHHADYAAFHGNFNNSNVIGNLCYKSFYRGMHFSGCTAVNIKYNTIVGWRTKTGIYMSGSSNANVYGNNIFTIATQHGNGMAFYDTCYDINIEKNFIFTPTNIGIAIQEYHGISGNVGYTIKNNVLFSDRGLKIYEVEKENCGMRGDLANFTITNNTGCMKNISKLHGGNKRRPNKLRNRK